MTKIDINEKKIPLLEKKNIDTYEKFIRKFPKKYFDCRKETGLSEGLSGQYAVIVGELTDITSKLFRNGVEASVAQIRDRQSCLYLSVTWFHTTYPTVLYEKYKGKEFFVFGKLNYDQTYGFQMVSPVFFDNNVEHYLGRLIPAYGKIKGISDDAYIKLLSDAYTKGTADYFSDEFRNRYGLPSNAEIARKLHYPSSENDINDSVRYKILYDLTFLNLKLKAQNGHDANVCINRNMSDGFMNRVISSLPYSLTADQQNTVNAICGETKAGRILNSLVQGDVSCGKTIVAFLIAMLFASNGCQAVIMAPTVVLASQHYNDMAKYAEQFSEIKPCFLGGKMTAAERRERIRDIKAGKYNIVIGTHMITGDDVEFKDLGVVVIDEEQRFGVRCREKLRQKSTRPISYITMSATPIPRTLAGALFGDNVGVYSIKSMPSGRQAVTTTYSSSFDIPPVVVSELESGRQAYVICPLISKKDDEDDESSDDSKNAKVISAEETFKLYSARLGSKYPVGLLNGKMKESEMLSVLDDFMAGKIKVLISTTVVEVGVNNPNASVIVIQNADRFGLSSLHQLRGRVRRGKYKPYCILVSQNMTERLDAMLKTDDGFEISKLDLAIRKTGDLIGEKQSGDNFIVNELIMYPGIYDYSKALAEKIILYKEDERFIRMMSEMYYD